MKRSSLVLIAIICFAIHAYGGLKLPAIFSSEMVLQRNTTVKVWGWTNPKEQVQLSVTWSDKPLRTKSNKDGEWSIDLVTPDAPGDQTMTIEVSDTTVVLDGVLLGEVWLCSGQSNMHMPVKGNYNQPIIGSAKALLESKNDLLRLFKVTKNYAEDPITDLKSPDQWVKATPETVTDFSAVAYFFGSQLQEFLNVPVGLIQSSWGGSTVQAWMSADLLTSLEQGLNGPPNKKIPNRTPAQLYNAMIHPLIPFAIKGMLWYQGEGNRNEPDLYSSLLPAMVEDWREQWMQGQFPFYYVQIAPYRYGGQEPFQEVTNTAFMREAMMKCQDEITNSGMAVIMDIGTENYIHPPRKKEVGERLLYLALSETYGHPAIDGRSPQYDSVKTVDEGLLLTFSHAEQGLYAPGGLKNFLIAGDDRVFHPADARIVGEGIIVQSEEVPNPVAVRYCWSNWCEGSLFDTGGLPASSFRTDSWTEATMNSIQEK